jgi:hypothetical protein
MQGTGNSKQGTAGNTALEFVHDCHKHFANLVRQTFGSIERFSISKT